MAVLQSYGVGRIGRDAEVRQTNNGTSVANFPLAFDQGYGQNKTTIWTDCSLFGKAAEGALPQYLVKGTQVHVTGETGVREYQKNDGTQGYAVTLNISKLDLVGSKPEGQAQRPAPQPQRQAPQQPVPVDDFDDSIPF